MKKGRYRVRACFGGGLGWEYKGEEVVSLKEGRVRVRRLRNFDSGTLAWLEPARPKQFVFVVSKAYLTKKDRISKEYRISKKDFSRVVGVYTTLAAARRFVRQCLRQETDVEWSRPCVGTYLISAGGLYHVMEIMRKILL